MMPRPWGRFFIIAWTACGAGLPSAARAQLLDEASLLVRRGEVVLGHENFSLTRTNLSDGSVGFRLAVVASYPERRPEITLRPLVEFGEDSLPRTVQLDVANGGRQRILGEFGRRRITIRAISPEGESAREYPAVARTLVADDSILSLYALPPGTAPGPVRLVAPRQQIHSDFRLANQGTETSTVAGQPVTMLHLVLTSGTDERHLWYDQEGRLMKVEIPAQDVTAERVPGRR